VKSYLEFHDHYYSNYNMEILLGCYHYKLVCFCPNYLGWERKWKFAFLSVVICYKL